MNWWRTLATRESAKEAIHSQPLTQLEVLILCLDAGENEVVSTKDLVNLAVELGVAAAKKWNISTVLTRGRGLIIREPEGWCLSSSGKRRAAELNPASLLQETSGELHECTKGLENTNAKQFLEEAIKCLDSGCMRASVVISWIGAISVLYQFVLKKHLASFNAEAHRRNPKWKNAQSFDDLANMKECDFLEVVCALSIIGKSVKQELEACLKLRNGCGHPNSLVLGELRVKAHIETLINNVFRPFGVRF